MAIENPQPNQIEQWVNSGRQMIQTAQKVIAGGDPSAAKDVLDVGVTIMGTLGVDKDKVAQVLTKTASGAIQGFATGGPIGAVAGFGAAALSFVGQTTYNVSTTAAGGIIQRRLSAWSDSLPLKDPTGNPMGWALYDYIAQVAKPERFPSYGNLCTPYLWIKDVTTYGCIRNGSFALNGGDQQNQRDYYNALTFSIKQFPGNTIDDVIKLAVKRSPPNYFFDAWTPEGGRVAFYNPNNPPVDVSKPVSNPLVKKAYPKFKYQWLIWPESAVWALPNMYFEDAFLALATIFGMVQVGATYRAIVSELAMQRAFYDTYNHGQKPSVPFVELMNMYINLALAEPTAPLPAPLPVKPNPKLPVLDIRFITLSARDAWVRYYLGEAPSPTV